jgi:hypothetical protein
MEGEDDSDDEEDIETDLERRGLGDILIWLP